MIYWVLIVGFSVWMAVEAYRRGQGSPWLWIILIFQPFGALVYFFAEYLPYSMPRWNLNWSRWTGGDLRHADYEVRRLDNSDAWTEYAHQLRLRKKYRQAIDAARNGLERDPANLRARYELGLGCLESGYFKEAAENLAVLTEEEKGYDDNEALYALASARLESGDLEGARETLEDLAERSTQSQFLYSLGAVQERCGDSEAARRTFQQIIDDAENVPKYHRHKIRPWVRRARAALRRL